MKSAKRPPAPLGKTNNLGVLYRSKSGESPLRCSHRGYREEYRRLEAFFCMGIDETERVLSFLGFAPSLCVHEETERKGLDASECRTCIADEG
jgi:hypothetical protein